LKQSINGQSFSYSGLYGQLSGLNITLLGEHQLENAACALAAIESLVFLGYKIDNKHIRKGLDLARWPGRLEVVYKKPLVVLDGAQNKASMLVLFGSLRKIFKYKKLFIILGISADKDIKGISRVVEAETQHIILTKSRHPRAAEPENIKRYFKKNKKEEIKVTNSLKDALNLSFKLSNKNDLIICCGSLFVVAEARKLLMKKNENKRII
jgi:dihydrofolate synthase/folylpolyglutamate synthase